LTTEAGIPRGLLLPRACPFLAANCRNEASMIGSRVSFHVDHSIWKASVTLLSRDLKTLTSLGLFRAPIQNFKDPRACTVADAHLRAGNTRRQIAATGCTSWLSPCTARRGEK